MIIMTDTKAAVSIQPSELLLVSVGCRWYDPKAVLAWHSFLLVTLYEIVTAFFIFPSLHLFPK